MLSIRGEGERYKTYAQTVVTAFENIGVQELKKCKVTFLEFKKRKKNVNILLEINLTKV